MNPALFPSLPSTEPANAAPGVYADLLSLVRLQFTASGFSFLPRQPVHSILAGRHASRVRGRGVNFEEIRRYLPGDDIRDMDWRVTARLGKPHVRVFTEERDRPLLLLIDQRRTMFFGSQRAMKSVTAAEAAALAAWRTFKVGDRVGAIVFNDSEIVEIRPHRSRMQVMRILETVVRLNRALRADDAQPPNPSMFDEALQRATRLATHDFLVCTVSDGFGVNDNSGRLATQLAAHNDLLVLFIYDPLEADLPRAGRAVFGQAGRQLEVDTAATGLRQAYASEFTERQAMIDRFCRQRTTPRLSISTARAVVDQVRQHLGKAAPAWGSK